LSELETQPRNEAGQFVPAVEGYFGKDREERESGFLPMTPAPKNDAIAFAAQDGADVLDLVSDREVQPETVVQYQSPETGERLPENLTISIEEAAADLTKFRNSNVESKAQSISQSFADEIDKLRADVIKGDAKVAEHFGVEVPKEAGAKEAIADNKQDPGQPGAPDPSAQAISTGLVATA